MRLSENGGRGKDAGAGGNMPPLPRDSRAMPPMPRHSRTMPRENAQRSSDRAARGHWPACLTTRRSKHANTSTRTSLRLLAVLNVRFKYACARQAARAFFLRPARA
ncbi:MAG: hypothetical protein OXL36_20990 [Bryobacterales bacterium]|nr:hypothetical protein [Bryobacterales bacterium]MDE0294939.1 hypothetical protein [Bryobacterales bacterium]